MRNHFSKYVVVLHILFSTKYAMAEWYPFTWVEHKFPGLHSSKAAILLPTSLNGVNCTLQLDTGSSNTILYRNGLPSTLLPDDDVAETKTLNFKIGPLNLTQTVRLMYQREKDTSAVKCNGVAGTLGNDFLLNGTLTLDLKNALYQFSIGPYLSVNSEEIAVPMELIETGNGGRVPVVTATLKNRNKLKLQIDSGSALADVIVFLKENWLELVGRIDTNKLPKFSAARWGHTITCFSAPSIEPINLDELVLDKGTVVTYCEDPQEIASKENFLFGILGFGPFQDRQSRIDYVSRKIVIQKQFLKE